MLLRPWTFLPKDLNFYHVFAWGTITTIMYTFLLTLLLHGHGIVHRFLSAPIFRRIATLGYGVYLVHIPLCDRIVVPIAKRLIAKNVSLMLVWPISLVLLIVMSATIAYLMHLLIEKPSMWIRDKIAASRTRRSCEHENECRATIQGAGPNVCSANLDAQPRT